MNIAGVQQKSTINAARAARGTQLGSRAMRAACLGHAGSRYGELTAESVSDASRSREARVRHRRGPLPGGHV